MFPCKYHQNGGFSMAMLVSGRVNSPIGFPYKGRSMFSPLFSEWGEICFMGGGGFTHFFMFLPENWWKWSPFWLAHIFQKWVGWNHHLGPRDLVGGIYRLTSSPSLQHHLSFHRKGGELTADYIENRIDMLTTASRISHFFMAKSTGAPDGTPVHPHEEIAGLNSRPY